MMYELFSNMFNQILRIVVSNWEMIHSIQKWCWKLQISYLTEDGVCYKCWKHFFKWLRNIPHLSFVTDVLICTKYRCTVRKPICNCSVKHTQWVLSGDRITRHHFHISHWLLIENCPFVCYVTKLLAKS